MFGTVQNIQTGVSLENMIAMFESGNDYGRHPLRAEHQAPKGSIRQRGLGLRDLLVCADLIG